MFQQMAITGYRKALVDWNATGNNSKLKISRANIKKETDLLEKCKACYRDDKVPLPKDIVTSVIVTLRKIRDTTHKEKTDARNSVSNAARSDLRKKSKDPDQHLDEAEQVTFKNMKASDKKINAKESELRKRSAHPNSTKPLTETEQVAFKKLKAHDKKRYADSSDLRKKNNDPDQHLDEAEQVAFKKDRASIDKSNAKATDWWKRYADPK